MKPQRDNGRVDERERPYWLAGLATLSLVTAVVPVPFGLVVTRPILAGLLTALFVRLFGLAPSTAAVAGAAPPIALLAVALLADGRFAAATSSQFRVTAWLALSVIYVLATCVGALLGRALRPAV